MLVATFGRQGPPHPGEVQQEFIKRRDRAIALLNQAIKGLEEELAEGRPQDIGDAGRAVAYARSNKVFVVHGHDEAALQAVARFLEHLELEAIVLHEQPDQGRTIIEKFEAFAGEVGFAVVLLTPDDLVAPAAASSQISRARQNVIFELGYFVGRLGRGRACLLRKGDVEIPSDLYGVIYTELDAGDGWKLKLVKEFRAAKLDFDASRVT